MESITTVLGKNFSGSIIEDPIIEPYFIQCSPEGYVVSRKRTDERGNLRYSDLSYPATFEGCLRRISKEKLLKEKQVRTLEEYVKDWQEIFNKISQAVRETKMYGI